MVRFGSSAFTDDEITQRIDGTDFGARGFIWFVKKAKHYYGLLTGAEFKKTQV